MNTIEFISQVRDDGGENLATFFETILNEYEEGRDPTQTADEYTFEVPDDDDISDQLIAAIVFGRLWRDEEMRGEYSGVVQ